MKIRIIGVTIALLLSPLAGGDMLTEDEAAVWEADRNWAKAVSSNDVDKVLEFYDEEAVFMGTVPPTVGLENLRGFWTHAFGMPNYRLLWKVERVTVDANGNFAFSSGSWEQSFSRHVDPEIIRGAYWAVWKKQPDGSWKVYVEGL